MKIATLLAWLLIVVTFTPGSSQAEIYEYKDENGVLHYTDNLNEVPEDQRAQIKRHKEAEDFLTPAQLQKKRQLENAKRRKSSVEAGKSRPRKAPKTLTSQQKRRLEKIKRELEQTRIALVQEQQALLKFNTKLADDNRLRSHRRQVMNLNKRIQAYEQERQAFERRLAKARSE